MSRYLAGLILGCFLALANSAHAQVTCPTLNNLSPDFNSPGQVFGRIDTQWNSYFTSKADANNGTLCNPTFGGNVSMQSLTIAGQLFANNGGSLTGLSITGLPTPTNASDAATKTYVDTVLTSGIAYHAPVALATAAALPANTYNNGASGIGATLTGNSFGALSVDGSSVTVNQRVLVKNESNQTNNGVYSVTATGGSAADYVLTRVTDFDTTATMLTNASFLVTGGSTLTGSAWALSTPNPVIPGTSAITFVQTALAGQAYNAGAGLTLTGSTFSISNAGVTAAMLASGVAASNLGYTPLNPANNLSDLSSTATSRSHLGLGSLATLSALPNPSSSTLGGAQSFTAPAGQALAGLTTSGTWTTVAVGGGSNPGGTSGQLQYNNAGALGGFTPSGACTVVASTGVFTCFGTSASTLSFTNITGQTTLAQLPNIGVGFLGNSAGTAAPSLLTATQATALLNACTATLKGEVPLPPNSTTQFLNGQCAWSTPSGAGNFTGPASAISNDLVSFNGTSGTLGQDSGIGQATVLTTTNGNTLATSRLTGQLTLAQLPSIGVGFLGNLIGTAPPSVLTAAQTTAALVGCSTSTQGVVPSPTGNAGQYLNGTCSWSTPPGGVSITGSPTTGNIAAFSSPSALQDSGVASSTLITTSNSATLPTSRITGTISAAQMLPLNAGQVYIGNGLSQPAASTLAFSNISGSLPLTQIQSIAVGLLGNLTGTAAPSLLTMTQVTAALNQCVTATQGLVPSPTGNASNYLNGQCAWTTPPVGGNFSGPNGGVVSGNLVSFNGTGGTLGQDSGLAAASVITTTNALNLPLSRTTGSLNAGQMLPLQSGQVYIGNTSSQPVSSALAFTNITGSLQLNQIQTIGVGFLGNSSGTAVPSLLTATQATALLNACTSTLQGLVPAPPNSATQFLNGTCAWSTPSAIAPGPATVNATTLGADPTGVNDNASTINTAISGGKTNLYFPAGTYKFNSALTASIGGTAGLTITGDGPQSKFVFGATNGIVVNVAGPAASIHFKNFACTTTAVLGGDCIHLHQTQSITNPAGSVTSDITNVTAMGSDGPVQTNVWTNGIWTDSVSDINIDNFTFFGSTSRQGTVISLAGGGDSNHIGVVYNIKALTAEAFDVGLRYGPQIQGVTISGGGNFTGCNTGILTTSATESSQLTVIGNQFACYNYGINNPVGVNSVFIDDNLFFLMQNGSIGISDSAANLETVSHNVFAGGTSTGTIGVQVTGGPGGGANISSNIFLSGTTGISLGASSSHIQVSNNTFNNTPAQISDAGNNGVGLFGEWSGDNIQFVSNGVNIAAPTSGSVGVFVGNTLAGQFTTGTFSAGNGVNCNAGTVNLSTLTVSGGIVTHC